jgi:peroxiredoxin Q/BCP
MLNVSQPAPDFEATLDDGSSFRLSSLRGEKNIVLYFYPADFTAGCTAEACRFRDSYEAMKALDAVVLGVSGNSAESHARFREKLGLGFPLIADEDRSIAALYDVRGALPLLRPRVTYVIDKQGVIRAAFRHDIAIGRHLTDTLRALDALEKSPTR